MKVFLSLFLFTSSYSVFSQSNFAKELDQIIKDTSNHFQKFKSSVRENSETESSYYNSTIILEGTKENWVIIHRSICSYSADIADSVTKNKGKQILNDWKMKLISALGTEFKIEKNQGLGNQFIDGWKFSKDNFSVSLDLSQYFYDKSLYGVRLFISNVHPTPKGL